MITEEMVRKAIELSLPTLRVLADQCGWGPKGFALIVAAPGLGLTSPVTYKMAELADPEPGWPDFMSVAGQKLGITMRTGLPSSVVVAIAPWLLMPGDPFYGGATLTDLGSRRVYCSASGAKSEADEAAAEIVLAAIKMLARLKRRSFEQSGLKFIPH